MISPFSAPKRRSKREAVKNRKPLVPRGKRNDGTLCSLPPAAYRRRRARQEAKPTEYDPNASHVNLPLIRGVSFEDSDSAHDAGEYRSSQLHSSNHTTNNTSNSTSRKRTHSNSPLLYTSKVKKLDDDGVNASSDTNGAAEASSLSANTTSKRSGLPRGGWFGLSRVFRRQDLSSDRKLAEDYPRERTTNQNLNNGRGRKHARKRTRLAPTLELELLGVALIFSALLVLIALISYSPLSALTKASMSIDEIVMWKAANWAGPFGHRCAESLTHALGLIAFWIPLAIFYAGALCVGARIPIPRSHHVAGIVMVVVSCAAYLEILLGDALLYPAAGAVGLAWKIVFVPLIASTGVLLLTSTLVVAGLMVFFELRLRELLASIMSLPNLLRSNAKVRSKRAKSRPGSKVSWQELAESYENESNELEDSAKPNIQPSMLSKASSPGKGLSSNLHSGLTQNDYDFWRVGAPAPIASRIPSVAGMVVRSSEIPSQSSLIASKNLGIKESQRSEESNERSGIRSYKSATEIPIEVDSQISNLKKSRSTKDTSSFLPQLGEEQKTRNITMVDEAIADKMEVEAFKVIEQEEIAVEIDDRKVKRSRNRKYLYPPLKLLDYDAPDRKPVDREALERQADKLIRKFADFGIKGKVREVRPGPVVTTYEFVPAPGIKVSKIASLADDIAMAMEAVHVRIVAPIPGKGAVGIEIPNERRETVFLKEIIADKSFQKSDERLLMALGKDKEGKSYSANLGEMPHVLISGTTGSGKSVSVNAMICSILYQSTPEEVKFLMIDPKMLELSIYEGIPHLLLPPIIDSKKASYALQWAVGEMERRYKAMSEAGVRDLKGFNKVITQMRAGKHPTGKKPPMTDQGRPYDKLPYIVIVIDEYADLLSIAGKEVEGYVMRLAQKARAAGIHVMLATQRPSVDVITGVIKANFPVRMGFRLASSHDSKTIINRPGAEKLLGRGDMLIMPPGTSNVERVHGAYISEKEIDRIVDHLKTQGSPDYDMSILEPPASEAEEDDGERPQDAKFGEAVDLVRQHQKCSTSWLQRKLMIGYNRAARMVDALEREGIVGPQQNAKGDREIFVR